MPDTPRPSVDLTGRTGERHDFAWLAVRWTVIHAVTLVIVMGLLILAEWKLKPIFNGFDLELPWSLKSQMRLLNWLIDRPLSTWRWLGPFALTAVSLSLGADFYICGWLQSQCSRRTAWGWAFAVECVVLLPLLGPLLMLAKLMRELS